MGSASTSFFGDEGAGGGDGDSEGTGLLALTGGGEGGVVNGSRGSADGLAGGCGDTGLALEEVFSVLELPFVMPLLEGAFLGEVSGTALRSGADDIYQTWEGGVNRILCGVSSVVCCVRIKSGRRFSCFDQTRWQ